MTPKQILDSFSETLMRDERILSPQERSLIVNLLQHAKAVADTNLETQEAVRQVIAAAVGETVAQRAFAALGGSIVERILEESSLLQSDSATSTTSDSQAELRQPQPPGATPMRAPGPPSPSPGQPQPPGVTVPHREPKPPHRPLRESPPAPPQSQPPGKTPLRTPGPPSPSPGQPQPPGLTTTKVVSSTVAAAERPERLLAKCVVLDEFLSPQELAELTRFTLEHEPDFQASEVVSPSAEKGVINYEHRRSRVLMELAEQQDIILARIRSVLPQVLEKLGMEPFAISDVEAQITASNDGDFFHFHSDNGSDRVASRYLTFVYFFHREPRPFEGGDLRIHDAYLQDGEYVSEGSYQTIVPQQNQIVFFPCELLHEISPVKCPSQLFADSRFTLNGWLRQ